MTKPKKPKKTKKIVEKPKLPWQKEEGFQQERFPKQIIPKQEKLIKGWRRT